MPIAIDNVPEHRRAVDTSVSIPDAVRAGASRADELIAAEQAKTRGEAPPTPVPPQPEGKDAQPAVSPVVAQNTQPQPQPPAPPPAPPQAPQHAPDHWEHLYRTWKGRHDALFATMQQERHELQRQIDELRQAQQPATPPPSDFDEEDDRTWGPDFRNAVQRRIDAAVAQVRQEITGQVQRVEQASQHGTEAALQAELTDRKSVV